MVRKPLRKYKVKFGILDTRSLMVHSWVLLLSLKWHYCGWLWLAAITIFRVFNSHMPSLYTLFGLKCMVPVQSSNTVSKEWGSKMKLSTIVLKAIVPLYPWQNNNNNCHHLNSAFHPPTPRHFNREATHYLSEFLLGDRATERHVIHG